MSNERTDGLSATVWRSDSLNWCWRMEEESTRGSSVTLRSGGAETYEEAKSNAKFLLAEERRKRILLAARPEPEVFYE